MSSYSNIMCHNNGTLLSHYYLILQTDLIVCVIVVYFTCIQFKSTHIRSYEQGWVANGLDN